MQWRPSLFEVGGVDWVEYAQLAYCRTARLYFLKNLHLKKPDLLIIFVF